MWIQLHSIPIGVVGYLQAWRIRVRLHGQIQWFILYLMKSHKWFMNLTISGRYSAVVDQSSMHIHNRGQPQRLEFVERLGCIMRSPDNKQRPISP